MSSKESRNNLIEIALEEIGYTEGARNDNKYSAIAGHANNLPWCASFVIAMFKKADLPKALINSASCQAIEKWAREKELIIPIEQTKRGDVVLMDFSNSGVSQHIGLALNRYNPERKTVHTIEGNTGDKSQTNGDGVYLKTRGAKFIRCIIRPRFPKDAENGVDNGTI